MANWAMGKVSRIYTHPSGTYISLANIPTEDTPGQGGYFFLRLNHPNYNALYSLALTAATNRLDLLIRIVGSDISPNSRPDVDYMTITWD